MGMVDYKRTTIRQVGDEWVVLLGVGRQPRFKTLEEAKAVVDREIKYSTEEMTAPGFAMSEKEKKRKGITNAFQNGRARAEREIQQRVGNSGYSEEYAEGRLVDTYRGSDGNKYEVKEVRGVGFEMWKMPSKTRIWSGIDREEALRYLWRLGKVERGTRG